MKDKETIIKIDNLTKIYPEDKGIFGIDLEIKKGTVYGFVGTNGSGKTTTIRHIMGFLHADAGKVTVMDKNSWLDSTELMNYISYVPGEIAFPDLATGTDFLKLQAEYLGITDFTYMNYLIEKLQLDPSAPLKRMSKGMKQKTALVAALIGNKDILVLDEPTTGLDPLMRDAFLDIIREEKKKGKTVFMSSHIFEEIEHVCDEVAMIKDGHIIDVINLWNLRHWDTKTFIVSFKEEKDFNKFIKNHKNLDGVNNRNKSITISFPKEDIKEFIKELTNYKIKNLREKHMTLEEYFRNKYKEEENK